MIALSMVLRGGTMSLGGVFMMFSCFVMCVFWHVNILSNRYVDSLTPEQVMNHWNYLVAVTWRMPLSTDAVTLSTSTDAGKWSRRNSFFSENSQKQTSRDSYTYEWLPATSVISLQIFGSGLFWQSSHVRPDHFRA
jgi:hypothetical protein